jgi:hypothetical protein
MANNLIHIDQSDLNRLNMNMRDFERELMSVCKNALKNLGARIVAQAQDTLRKNDNIYQSHLINSGRTAEAADGSILAGFPMKHAGAVEFGRRGKKQDASLKYPPYYFIRRWVDYRGLGADDKEAKSIAFAIRAKIGEEGSKPHPFLRPAYEKNKPLLVRVLMKGAAKVMNKDYTRR